MSPRSSAGSVLSAPRTYPSTGHLPDRGRSLAASLLALCAAAAIGCSGGAADPPATASGDELMAWAEARVEAGDLSGGTVGYRRVLQADSLRAEALLGLAKVYGMQKKDRLADRYRRRAFHIDYHKGVEWLQAGHPDSARSAFQAATRTLPQHPLGYLRLGEMERLAGRLDAAIALFERAVAANPDFVESLIALGETQFDAGNTAAARQSFGRAIEVNINAFEAYMGLGRILASQSQWAQAAAQYEKALLVDPGSADARRELQRAQKHL